MFAIFVLVGCYTVTILAATNKIVNLGVPEHDKRCESKLKSTKFWKEGNQTPCRFECVMGAEYHYKDKSKKQAYYASYNSGNLPQNHQTAHVCK